MIIPLTLDAMKQFYGSRQMRTVRGYAVTDGDSIDIVFGIYLDADYWVLFADMSEQMREKINTMSVKKLIVRCNKILRKMLMSLNIPVLVLAESKYANAGNMLEHFGYKNFKGEVHIWAL